MCILKYLHSLSLGNIVTEEAMGSTSREWSQMEYDKGSQGKNLKENMVHTKSNLTDSLFKHWSTMHSQQVQYWPQEEEMVLFLGEKDKHKQSYITVVLSALQSSILLHQILFLSI